MSSTSVDDAGDTPSTSGSKVHGNKGKVKFPYRLYEGNHPIHLCPYLDEAQKVLDNHPASLLGTILIFLVLCQAH